MNKKKKISQYKGTILLITDKFHSVIWYCGIKLIAILQNHSKQDHAIHVCGSRWGLFGSVYRYTQ